MPIATSSALEVKVKIDCPRDLTVAELVKLAKALDEYEVENNTTKSLVIDTKTIKFDGTFEFYLTPHYTVTYEEILEHVESVVPYAMDKADLSDFAFKFEEITFHHKDLGTPSFVHG